MIMRNSIIFFALSFALSGAASLLYGQQSTFSKVFYDIEGGIQAYSIVESYDHNYLIVGEKDYKGFILKMDTTGNVLWSRTINNYGMCFYSVIRTTDSCYVLAGKQDNPSNYNDIICIKLNQNGDTLWSKRIDTGISEIAYSVNENDDQGYILTGYTNGSYPILERIFVVRLSSNGELVWIRTNLGDNFDNYGYSARQVPDGGFLVTGFTENTSFNSGACLIKLFPDGTVDWFKKLETQGGINSTGFDIQIVPDGFFCYFMINNYKLLFVKTDFSGNIIYTKSYHGIYGDTYLNTSQPKLHSSSDGGFISITPGQSGNLIKMDSEGNVIEAINLVLIPTDIIEMTDKGFIILGNGPLIGVDKVSNPQIGIIRTDSLGQGSDCVFPLFYYQDTINAVFTNLSTSGTTSGMLEPIYPEISDISLTSVEGCVDVLGGVREIKSNTLMVYPNPANDNISIKIPIDSGAKGILYLSNIFGQQVNMLLVSDAIQVQTCNVSSLPVGLYILTFISESQIITGKFEISR